MLLEEINGIDDLRPGDIGFGPISGFEGMLIKGALTIADGKAPYQHVYMITEAAQRIDIDLHWVGPFAVEAMPGGAIRSNIRNRWSREYCYVRPNYTDDSQAALSAATAIKLVGTPYSYLDYIALAGRHFFQFKPESRTWFDDYITSTKHMICSQLVDYCLTQAGWHVFNDGRLSQDVTPSALYNKLEDWSPRLIFAYPV
jgi:uncharacterized protein YycO